MTIEEYRELVGDEPVPTLRRALAPYLREAFDKYTTTRPRLRGLLKCSGSWRRLEPLVASLSRAVASGRGLGFSPEKDMGLCLAWIVDALERRGLMASLARSALRRRTPKWLEGSERNARRLARALESFDRAQRKQIDVAIDAVERPLEAVNLERLKGSPCPRPGCAGLLCRSTDSYRAGDEKDETRLSCTRCSFHKVVA